MLSRVADSLYWMSRYLERAEHIARVLNVTVHGLLGQRAEIVERRWRRVLRSLYPAAAAEQPLDPYLVVERLTFDPDAPNSIVKNIWSARQNAREIREQISSEMWEQLNRLYLHVQHGKRATFHDDRAHTFFQEVKEGAHLFQGITDTTLSHEDGWYFIQLGRYIERVVATVRLLEAHFLEYGDVEETVASELYLEWVDLLKSCTAFEAYCRIHTANITADRATAFLLLHPDFPHSVRFGVNMILQSLSALSESNPALKQSEAHRVAGRLGAILSFDSIEEIRERDILVYLTDIRTRCMRVHQAVYETCIAYPIELAVQP